MRVILPAGIGRIWAAARCVVPLRESVDSEKSLRVAESFGCDYKFSEANRWSESEPKGALGCLLPAVCIFDYGVLV
jgi:hypothetical protein